MNKVFELDTRLENDSVFIADGLLSQIRLMNDARFPWLILVPRVADVTEWIDLDGNQQRLLLAEINQISHLIKKEFTDIDKLNIGALGNIVRQLHIHIVGRRINDSAWPGSVWGNGSAQIYSDLAMHQTIEKIIAAIDWKLPNYRTSIDLH